jgi:mannose-6-phosphate isomerase-like protein (cupin superfamily)
MTQELGHIAARLRELREIAGLSPETLARDLGIPIETCLEYEKGTSDIPVSFLCEAARRLSVDLVEILTGEAPRLRSYCLVRKDTGVTVERRSQYRYQHLAYNFVHKKAEPFLVTVDPETEDTPFLLSSHPGQEFAYILEGALTMRIGDRDLILREGDSLYYDSGQKHGVKALEGSPARFLAIIF